MRIELDEEIVDHLKQYWNPKENLQQKVEDAVNSLLKDWISVQHSKKELQIIKNEGKNVKG